MNHASSRQILTKLQETLLIKRIKQYTASYGNRVEVINFRPFQADIVGAVLKEDGLTIKDANALVAQWNHTSNTFVFAVVQGAAV